MTTYTPSQYITLHDEHVKARKKAAKYEYDKAYRAKNANKNTPKKYNIDKVLLSERQRRRYAQLGCERTDIQIMISNSRQRAKRIGVDHNITEEYIASIWNKNCPILGLLLERGKGRVHDASPSIDRIDPSKGYVIGNVAIISNKANVIKSYGSAEEHRLIAEWMDKKTY